MAVILFNKAIFEETATLLTLTILVSLCFYFQVRISFE